MALTPRRIWDSPTMMTWAAQAAGAARFFLVLPFLLRSFTAPDVAVWYLMGTLSQVLLFFDLGFSSTGSRFFAYAMGGATSLRDPKGGDGKPNHQLMARVYRSLRVMYPLLALGALLAIGAVGTWMLRRPIGLSPDPAAAWWAWGVTLAGSTFTFANLVYPAYLTGTNRVALAKRWEAIGHTLSAVLMLTVLGLGGGLLQLAVAAQLFGVLVVFRDAWLAHRTEPATFAALRGLPGRVPELADIWRSAWRSGVGVILNAGTVRLSAGIVAQVVAPATLAAYLLAFNVLDRINQVSMAPFYAKLPAMASLYSRQAWAELRAISGRAIRLTLALLAAFGVLGAAALMVLLRVLDSETPFIGLGFWSLLLAALLVHRYGAMQLQLYTLTNHVVWHVADGVAGALYALALAALLMPLDVLAVPAAMLIAYGGFYTLYSVRKQRTAAWARPAPS